MVGDKLLIFEGFGQVSLEVLKALSPLLIVFIIFQLLFMKRPWSYVAGILKGMALTFIGLALFLQGVTIGFLPIGTLMGEKLGGLEHNWVIIPIGFVLGFTAALAEPAVRILSSEVEEASSGYIKRQVMLYTLSLGVAVFTAVGLTRIVYGIPFHYLVIPGYLLALGMLKFSDPTFIAIAFDSGGVATGPMTVTFVMAMAIGVAAVMEGRNPVVDGFGLVAMVALAPILLVMALGFIYRKQKEDSDDEPGEEA